MSAITNQRAKTSHILLTHTVNSCCTDIKVAGSHFTYISVILEHLPKLHQCDRRFCPLAPCFFVNFFILFFNGGGEGKCKEKDGGLRLLFFKD